MRRNIVLIGFPNTGKSSVSRELAQRLKLVAVEVDDLITGAAGATRAGIFAKGGEALFRRIEREQVMVAAAMDGAVISCGGGVVLDPENVAKLRENGIIVLLTAPEAVILARAAHQHDRPIFSGPNPESRIRRLMAERLPAYEAAADIVVDTADMTVGAVADAVIERCAGLIGR